MRKNPIQLKLQHVFQRIEEKSQESEYANIVEGNEPFTEFVFDLLKATTSWSALPSQDIHTLTTFLCLSKSFREYLESCLLKTPALLFELFPAERMVCLHANTLLQQEQFELLHTFISRVVSKANLQEYLDRMNGLMREHPAKLRVSFLLLWRHIDLRVLPLNGIGEFIDFYVLKAEEYPSEMAKRTLCKLISHSLGEELAEADERMLTHQKLWRLLAQQNEFETLTDIISGLCPNNPRISEKVAAFVLEWPVALLRSFVMISDAHQERRIHWVIGKPDYCH